MEYRTVFDITESGYRTWFGPAFGLIFVAVGTALVFFRNRLPHPFNKNTRYNRIFSVFFFSFAVLWTLAVFASTYHEYATLAGATRAGRVETVEGVVTEFDPMPYQGHRMERFCVGKKCFQYSDYVVTAAFNHSASHGGPIRNGLAVRVTFVGNAIVKLEVAGQ